MAQGGYDPKKSRVSDSTLQDFLRGKITGDIQEVPGVGPATAKKLAGTEDDPDEERITNTFQLIGKFLMLKGPEDKDTKVSPGEHTNRFWHWLAEKGITAHRSAIVRAIAEKMNQSLPGIYNADEYESGDED